MKEKGRKSQCIAAELAASAQAGVVVFQKKQKPPMIKRLLCSKVLRLGLQQGLRSPFCVGKPHLFVSSLPSIAHARPWVEKGNVRLRRIRNVVSIVMYGMPAGCGRVQSKDCCWSVVKMSE
jgi:hypothetical protein